MKKLIFLSVIATFLVILAFGTISVTAQVFHVQSNLPPILHADAGSDNYIVQGDSVQLGGEFSASNGYGDYIYLWEPDSGLADPTLPNPWAKPETTTTYRLTVTDGHNCSSIDDSIIKVGASGIHDLKNSIQIDLYPNPASNYANISIKGMQGIIKIRIHNTLGQIILEKE